MLLFGKWLCCFESSIATDEWSHMIIYIKGFPYPVGKLSNTSPPLRNSATAFSCCGLVLNPKCRANKFTRQPIGTTTRFSGSDATGQHYRPASAFRHLSPVTSGYFSTSTDQRLPKLDTRFCRFSRYCEMSCTW